MASCGIENKADLRQDYYVIVMKVLHIAPFFHGGVGTVALNLTKEFVKMGLEVILAAPTPPPHELKVYVRHSTL